ncbi:GNAT family N-acetyltransferase [Cellulomonas sp. URHD0024]|uniref:GNAT family N-acetyltransferase n=1 Tax=Cellulomonas sp. URHD0024 TaxID=1302620 RepID=UPI0003F98A20|nr:GNAT family N-acetyltransferase [Cellulomonas sp. URHD0024]
MSVDVRTARPDEYDAVATLTEHGFATGPFGPSQDPARLALLRDAAGRAAAGDLLVAADGDRLLGTASLLRPDSGYTRQARDGEAELRLLATAPDARGQGVGAALLAASVDRARAWGVSALVLDTGARNVASQRLYHRLGFERLVERESVEGLVVFGYDFSRTGLVVRLVAPHEYERVAELSVEAYAHDYDISDEYRTSLADVATRAREHEVWVVEDLATGELLGTVATPRPGGHISPLGQEGELDFRLLAVSPAARRRGIGALLTEHVITLARRRSLDRVVMNSGPQMLGAHALYHRLGFVRLTDRETRVVAGGTLLAFGFDTAPLAQGARP